MSIHKLTAGSGYDYLTRQVAALDATDKGHVGLASYYTEKGESPGVWVGSGMAGIDGLEVGNIVTSDQMSALFGAGLHPLADERVKELDRRIGRPGQATATDAEYRAASRLGLPFKVYANDVSTFRIEVATRIAAANDAAGLPADWPIPAADRAKIRTEVAHDFFRDEHGRDAADARELAATIAKHSRPKTNAVAGFDLTFSPVKSVSTLWAVADPKTAALIERAHQTAVSDALGFVENKALFTRMGTNGVRQVDVRGLVATAFTHRDSRAGDPDLHTHVAVANKVQTLDGKWRAIDGRVLFKATVAASEVYNTALEHHLVDTLGVRFAERPNEDARKRPVREIVGVDPALNTRFSKRRLNVEDRRTVLAMQFQATHGRPATPVEALHLAQQATLETREAKHEPRTLAAQRDAWDREAVAVLGSARRLKQMIHGALNPKAAAASLTDSKWFSAATARIVATMEGSRATWQYWHVYADAQRQVRTANVPTSQVSAVADLLVRDVLDGHSVSLARPSDGLAETPDLRRVDGSSVYTVAGADLYTSSKVLGAEQRVVAAAGRRDGFTVEESRVGVALLESQANGLALNAGQATLVREMATSGARLQLAIAPAGSGKTTAMEVLSRSWTSAGGTVMGAATATGAAKLLGEKIQAPSDSLAMLVTAIENDLKPARDIGANTLLIIDEAGMADTQSLDTVVSHVLTRGGSVRLIGDDQQLAAIGAGGILRDIQATHGALQLTELVRFQDPAEGAASLALREGKPESLGFYLDHGRVRVGDLATMTEEVFASWQADRGQGLDSMMLAPSRELVSDLNRRAQASRLEGADPTTLGPWAALADGNSATIGDIVVTRDNDRGLRVSATDWVKNGDRWTVLDVNQNNGELTVQHLKHGRHVRLPAAFVRSHTELGYASTVHRAQGLTADKTHGLATGQESRQLLYTLMSRGAVANHIYLELVGDGDPHSVLHPTLIRPLTPTDMLESMLANDAAQRSATTLMREQADPATRLGAATQQYLDSLYFAAEQVVGPEVVDALDATVEQVLPGLVDEAAWPTLRAHLLLLGAHGESPAALLQEAATGHELASAHDRAAVLDWRLDATGHRNAGVGPLPWTPGIPTRVAKDARWGAYLTGRSQLVSDLADQVRDRAGTAASSGSLPSWAHNGLRADDATVADVEVWRAAMQVAAEDRRPTGPAQLQKAAATYQRRLTRKVTGDHTPALKEWRHLLHAVAPQVGGDEFTPLLAERLAAMSRTGLDAHQLLRSAVQVRPLPDEHAAAALWWRMARHLTLAVAEQVGTPIQHDQVHADWAPLLAELVGAVRAERLQASTWWPALVANLDHGMQRGWQLEGLLTASTPMPYDDVDECQALVWHTSITLDPIPDPHSRDLPHPEEEPPEDLWEGVEPPADAPVVGDPADHDAPLAENGPELSTGLDPDATLQAGEDAEEQDIWADLNLADYLRDLRGITDLETTEADLRRMYGRAADFEGCTVTRERMAEINNLTQKFFENCFVDSWGRDYLTERFGVDLAGHEHFRPGQAPAGWTNLVDHLRRHDVRDEEMLEAGVAVTSRRGTLIDRFRDRTTFPITRPGTGGEEVLGFVGRRHPRLTDADKGGPKYLNTADTALFHKGAQLFGTVDDLLEAGSIPVLVEGPIDAIAVTFASAGRYIGLAPLGTWLPDELAAPLAVGRRDPVSATDADVAGQVAAERDFWMLTPHGMDPGYAHLPDDLDPADLLELRGPAALVAALETRRPLGERLLNERLTNLPPEQARLATARVLAARPGAAWDPGMATTAARLQLSQFQASRDLRDAVSTWDADPREVARNELANSSDVRTRLQAAAEKSPAERWAPLASELDPRLVDQGDWPATAAIMQEAHDQGHDVAAVSRALVGEAPLGVQPANDLRYRLVSRLDVTFDVTESPAAGLRGAAHERRDTPRAGREVPQAPRR
ncbi:MAG: relaxase domain-containing protein [Brachybacterium sp.]|nr:relaxase domain-containing protein [Brachybacterium sp.]